MSVSPATYAGASLAAIQQHYDVGNAFYAAWLDPTMTYSCALWPEQDDGDDLSGLEAAQLAKIDWHIQAAGAVGAKRVLEVGSGWGALAGRLVRTHGVQSVVTLTLSAEQQRFVQGLAIPGVEARLEGWQEHQPTAAYDAIISVAAFEAFARTGLETDERVAAYRRFFRCCHAWLKPGGSLAVQTICTGNMWRRDFSPFFAQEIFPESDLPALHDIAAACDRLFEVVLVRNDRLHYARTLRCWRQRLAKHRQAAIVSSSAETVERYERYLDLARIGFATGTMGLLRLRLRRIDAPRLDGEDAAAHAAASMIGAWRSAGSH
jgi:cyclopropane-fatty-acyl-phospholipid synthase